MSRPKLEKYFPTLIYTYVRIRKRNILLTRKCNRKPLAKYFTNTIWKSWDVSEIFYECKMWAKCGRKVHRRNARQICEFVRACA